MIFGRNSTYQFAMAAVADTTEHENAILVYAAVPGLIFREN